MKKLKELSKIWWAFLAGGLIYTVIGITFCNTVWINSFLQIGAIILSLVFTLLVNNENNRTLAANHQMQLEKITENTNMQIEEIRLATEKEIEAIRNATDRQIQNYQEETRKLVGEMRTSSELLAGILQRQLEEAITATDQQLIQARHHYQNLSGFKLLRTPEEKASQLRRQKGLIDAVTNKLLFFKNQYERVVNFFRGGN